MEDGVTLFFPRDSVGRDRMTMKETSVVSLCLPMQTSPEKAVVL
jgi:hypothetical protein